MFNLRFFPATRIHLQTLGASLVGAWRTGIFLPSALAGMALVSGCSGRTVFEEVWSRPKDAYGVFSVSAADLKGDKHAGLLVGISGGAVAYFGSVQGLPRQADWKYLGLPAGGVGYCVGSAGHLSDDPYPVIFMSVPRLRGRGAVYLFRTGPKGPETKPWKILWSPAKGEGFGERVVRAGDLFGDGYDDLAVADFSYGAQTGKVYVYRGGPQGPGAKPVWAVQGEHQGDWFGYSLCAPGDLDGDGFDDLAVGSKNCNGSCLTWLKDSPDLLLHQDFVRSEAWRKAGQQTQSGRLSLFYGSKKGLSAQPDRLLEGNSPHALFAYALAPARNVEGGAEAGMLVGSIGWHDRRGMLQVFVGGPQRTLREVWRTQGDYAAEGLGFSQCVVPDFTEKGTQDLLVDGLSPDDAWLYRHFETPRQTHRTHLWTGPPTKARFSEVFGSAGDIYGDGRNEVFLTVPGDGRLAVLRGGADGP